MMPAPGRELCRDMLVVCFSQILPWNDPHALKAAMSFDSERLSTDETVSDYEKNAVRAQLRGMKTLKRLTVVSRLFSEAAKCVLGDFKEMFLAWISTQDCTIEGVHAGMIVFQSCSETVELLCEKMQYAGVSGNWSPFGWYDDPQTQYEQIQSDAASIIFSNNSEHSYQVMNEDILFELMKRLLLALRFHPSSQKIFAHCACLLTNFKDVFDWEDDCKIVELLQMEITKAVKPNFKLMNPRLWDLNMSGINVDTVRWRNTQWQRDACKRLNEYVQALCHAWHVMTLIQDKEITLQMNQQWLEKNHRQNNWFSVNHHVILLLQLRQIVIMTWL